MIFCSVRQILNQSSTMPFENKRPSQWVKVVRNRLKINNHKNY